ncbi:hypothetical protein HOG16_02465 [Candidatus Woesearchaeota archaeon]|jgi:hypothetical protein|nr:hypothetical protein [Candidatus Woesearchaeota archaeon]MBT4321960.1 hypothetical protein [Candidatus Woesearchaeota archaeon]MBT4631312.1 hypothetical protein [Candidatus Woesearchaeota archaeon]
MVKKNQRIYPHHGGRALFILSGLISLFLGYLLWSGAWTLEQVFAVLLFVVGAFKLIIGFIKS